MKKTLTYCDLCGKEVQVGIDTGSFRLVGKTNNKTVELTTIVYKDLCPTCTYKLFFLVKKLMKGVKK
jgi:hypothetical protein